VELKVCKEQPQSGGTETATTPTQKNMTPDATDDRNARTATSEETRRYAELNVGDEEFVIYDRENHEAWLQSTVAVPVEEIC
jgi:hypothetical protein